VQKFFCVRRFVAWFASTRFAHIFLILRALRLRSVKRAFIRRLQSARGSFQSETGRCEIEREQII